jgi:hypothetical protein
MGRGALVMTLFGAGWFGWGLNTANAFTPAISILFILFELILLAYSGFFIWKGRVLQKKYPSSPNPVRKKMNRQFGIVVVLEGAGIAIAVLIANAIHRPDLIPAWIGIVVGLHFLPLAKIFRAPVYNGAGIAMVAWCVFCWIVFRGERLTALAGIGTGAMLWATSAYIVVRAQKLVWSITTAASD